MSSAIALKSLTKQFASSENGWDNSIAVDDVTLEVGEREFLVLVGLGGCGKSTIMRLIAGLETPTSGDIYINGHRVNDIPVKARNVGLMFQGYALFKHMTVADNIGFGLKIRGVSKRERQHRIGEMVSLMGLEGLEDWKPDQLSGDHQQRVGFGQGHSAPAKATTAGRALRGLGREGASETTLRYEEVAAGAWDSHNSGDP